MSNRLKSMQEMLYNQMKRLDDDELMEKGLGNREIKRSSALSQSVSAYVKAVNISLKIKEMTKGSPDSEDTILKEIGVLNDEE